MNSGFSFVRKGNVFIRDSQFSNIAGICFYSISSKFLHVSQSEFRKSLQSLIKVDDCSYYSNFQYNQIQSFTSVTNCLSVIDCTFRSITLSSATGCCSITDLNTNSSISRCMFYECRKGIESSGVFSSGISLSVEKCCFSGMDNVHQGGHYGGIAVFAKSSFQASVSHCTLVNAGETTYSHSSFHFYYTRSIFSFNNISNTITKSVQTYTTGVLFLNSTSIISIYNNFEKCINGNVYYPYKTPDFDASYLSFINCSAPSGSGVVLLIYGGCNIHNSIFMNNTPLNIFGVTKVYTISNCYFDSNDIKCSPSGYMTTINCYTNTFLNPIIVNDVNTYYCVGRVRLTDGTIKSDRTLHKLISFFLICQC